MFLSLERPLPDKFVSVMARNLAGETRYDPMNPDWDWDSERSRVDRVALQVNKELDPRGWKLFGSIFNQFAWTGTSGWELWSENYALMLLYALTVAQRLEQPLHVHVDQMEGVLRAATACGVTFDFDFSQEVTEVHQSDDMHYINKRIAEEQYFVLSNVVMPNNLMEVVAQHK
jgi:hypothetical protein